MRESGALDMLAVNLPGQSVRGLRHGQGVVPTFEMLRPRAEKKRQAHQKMRQIDEHVLRSQKIAAKPPVQFSRGDSGRHRARQIFPRYRSGQFLAVGSNRKRAASLHEECLERHPGYEFGLPATGRLWRDVTDDAMRTPEIPVIPGSAFRSVLRRTEFARGVAPAHRSAPASTTAGNCPRRRPGRRSTGPGSKNEFRSPQGPSVFRNRRRGG